MKTRASLKNRQGGAVAVVVGISIALLVGFLALVIDLGHVYLARTGLQNAADAAALAGAKELKGDLAGINNAVAQAIATAAQNTFLENLGQIPVTITDANVFFSNQPYPASWLTVSQAQASPASLFFIKVETGQRDLDTWLAPIWNILHTNAFGMAVAGQSTAKVTPLAICAIDVRQCPCLPGETNCGQGNLQCGYEAGKSFHITDINPIGPGTPIWIDAVATSPSTCESTSTHDSRPFVCQGEAHISTAPGDFVYTNTGWSTPLANALDSRFGDYAPSGRCDPATAPPDSNVQEYAYQLFSDVAPLISGKNPYKNQPTIPDWLTPMPNPGGTYPQTGGCTPTGTLDQYGANIYNCPWSPNGVYWAAASSVTAVSGVAANSNYPGSGAPYTQTSGSYFRSGGSGSLAGRRLINLMVVQCNAVGGVCRPARNRLVGQFLLQTRAAVANDVNLEFVRTVTQQEIAGQIRLFQ